MPGVDLVRRLRHDVDDVYDLRLEEIQQALDLQNGRLDRIEDTQRQILDCSAAARTTPRSSNCMDSTSTRRAA